jgi:membrane protein YdbS with pleckstrin-like domain
MPPEEPVQPAPPTPPPIVGAAMPIHEDLLEADEHVLTVVRRSTIGLVGIYLVATLAVAAIVGLAIAIAPGTFKPSGATISGPLSGVIVLSAVFLALILFVATYVYRQSRLMVTDKSLVQVMQKTLFIRKVSRLSMSNVEDVNEEQRGILASLFNYGTLTVQTAGTEDNFIFTLCPSPAKLADKIIEARQAYAKSNPAP